MDDAVQPDAGDSCDMHPVNNATNRGTKGNRQAQAARYYLRNKARRRAYMRRYMAARRARLVG